MHAQWIHAHFHMTLTINLNPLYPIGTLHTLLSQVGEVGKDLPDRGEFQLLGYHKSSSKPRKKKRSVEQFMTN